MASRLPARAASRAKASFAHFALGRDRQELLVASLAVNSDSPESRTDTGDNKILAITDPLVRATHIASLARRNQILGRVVPSISVQMVYDQGTFDCSMTWHPVDLTCTPVAQVGSGTDLFVQNIPVRTYELARAGQWVARSLDHSVSSHGKYVSTSRSVP